MSFGEDGTGCLNAQAMNVPTQLLLQGAHKHAKKKKKKNYENDFFFGFARGEEDTCV